jgi:hypothetical protein
MTKLEVTNPNCETHVFRCDCHDGYLELEWWRDDEWGYVTLHHFSAPMTRRARWRLVWGLLRTGFIHADDVHMHPETTNGLRRALDVWAIERVNNRGMGVQHDDL